MEHSTCNVHLVELVPQFCGRVPNLNEQDEKRGRDGSGFTEKLIMKRLFEMEISNFQDDIERYVPMSKKSYEVIGPLAKE